MNCSLFITIISTEHDTIKVPFGHKRAVMLLNFKVVERSFRAHSCYGRDSMYKRNESTDFLMICHICKRKDVNKSREYLQPSFITKAKTILSQNCREMHFGRSKLSVFAKPEFKEDVFIL